MKPFLGIDLTLNKNNHQINGFEFLVQKPSDTLLKSLEISSEKAENTVEKAKLPLLFRIVQFVCGGVALLTASGILKADVSFAQGYQNVPWLFWLGAICLVVWASLKLLSMRKAKDVLETDESSAVFHNFDQTREAVFSELGVPPSAKDVDVLSFLYKVKDGKIKVCEKGLQIAPYFSNAFRVFADSDHLYLVNLDGKYIFPLSSIKAIQTVKKSIRIDEWNKDEPYNKGIYKQYKLSTDNYGCIHCKPYHILDINHQGESYGIYFPCYELPLFEELTGLNAETA